MENEKVMYTKPGCVKCSFLEKILNKKSIIFSKKNISEDDNSRLKLENNNIMSLPVMEIDGNLISDYNQLLSLFKGA